MQLGPLLLSTIGIFGWSEASQPCTIKEARVKIGNGRIHTYRPLPPLIMTDFHCRLSQGRRLPETSTIVDHESIKFSITLAGACDVIQSNLVFSPVGRGGRLAYALMQCGKDKPETCRATVTLAELGVSNGVYKAVVLFASRDAGDGPVSAFKWDLGMFDFAGVTVSGERGLAASEQQEDVFEKIHAENRPPFGGDPEDPLTGVTLAAIFSGIVLLPWRFLGGSWKKTHALHTIVANVKMMTLTQKIFYCSFISWAFLAIASWRGLDIFATVRIGAALALSTFVLGLRGLRQAVASSGDQK